VLIDKGGVYVGCSEGEDHVDSMDDLLNYQVPHSIEAEQAVLGAMLIDSRCIPDVVGILQPDDFYVKKNKEIFTAIFTMFSFSETIDPVTVLDKMKLLGTYSDNSRAYVVQLMEITPTAAHAARYSAIIREKSILRGLLQTAEKIAYSVRMQDGTAAELLEKAEQAIYSLRKTEKDDTMEHIGVVMHHVFDQLGILAQSDSKFSGMSTGMRSLDLAINGLNNSDLIIVAARPGMGKTAFALNIASNVAKKYDKSVAVFSLEMATNQLGKRLLAGESFVDSRKLNTGRLVEKEWMQIGQGASALSQTNIYLDGNPDVTVGRIKAKCRRLDNIGLIIIDYLQLMDNEDRTDSRVNAIGNISRSLKKLAMDINVPVICLSQLNRGPEKEKRRPVASDLRDSGNIEQDADVILMLYREDFYDKNSAEPNVAECIVAKNRHGETSTVKLQWMPQFTTFTDLEWKHPDI